MVKRLFSILAALLLTAGVAVPSAWAELAAVGPVSGPHGFPLYYTDSSELSLELCLDADWCFFDPIDPDDPNHVELGVGGEVFWWMAEAEAPVAGVANGRALLVLALEGTFGGDESVVNGQQISFGRVRVRVDVPAPGTYRVIHPFTPMDQPMVFENVTVADGINFTADIGGANFLAVEEGFAGALQSDIGPFLTWTTFNIDPELNDPALQVREPVLDEFGEPVLDEEENPVTQVVAQYVGNMDIEHEVVGSPFDTNFFRVIGPNDQVIAETNLFAVMGKVWNGDPPADFAGYPPAPDPNLADVGPINRIDPFAPGSVADMAPDGTIDGYPFGYPIWYEDETGLQLTICQGGNPMCISDPVNLNDPVQAEFRTGGETFWWSADAEIEQSGVDALLVLGLEGTFGGSEAIIDGQQISFGRTRIRITTPIAGDYTVIYPYGMKVFNNVPAGTKAINFTADIGIADPTDPDFAFVGALFSEIGPNFLTWTTFDPTLENNDERLVKQEPAIDANGEPILVEELDNEGVPTGELVQAFNTVHYVGDPGIEHLVTGGLFEYEGETVNYFRVIGPNGIDVRTDLFVVSGRVFDPDTFRVFQLATVPAVQNDAATTVGTDPVTIDVLANDSLTGAAINPEDVTVLLSDEPELGEAIVNEDNTITYTAFENAAVVRTDTFTYTVTNDATSDISAPATVTVTILPEEAVTVNRAQLDLRKLRWEIRGTGNVTAEGRTLTVRLNSTDGAVIGTSTVDGGGWRVRATTTTAPPAGQVQIFVISSGGASYGPFNVQVR